MQIGRGTRGGETSKELPMVAYNHNDVAEVALPQCQMVVACELPTNNYLLVVADKLVEVAIVANRVSQW